MIQIEQLHFTYPDSTFHLGVDRLAVEAGSSVALIGASGTGKTTLLNLVSGVLTPKSGQVQTNGIRVSSLDDTRRRTFRIRHVGMIFQEFELLEYLNVLDNILLPYRITGALQLGKGICRRAIELAGMVGLEDKLDRHIRHLSQGERQRVAICRSLVTDPPLILADEPTGNLDPENTDRVLDIIFEYVQQSGATFVCVTHERHYLNRFDRVIDFADFRKEGAHA